MAWVHDPQRLTVVCEDASALPQEEFAMVRRQGLGASDASVYLGLQAKWRTTEDLIANKVSKIYTDEEREVSKKVIVRMGNALEPLILMLFQEQHEEMELIKPKQMFRFNEFPYITINFDGVAMYKDDAHVAIPVEAKFVTIYGDKYYDFTKAETIPTKPLLTERDILAHCTEASKHYGIPDYYYAQVQQQLLGLNASHGYLTCLREKDKTSHSFLIYTDPWLQKRIIVEGYKVWERILKRRDRA